ncbi:hypothetical protein [Shinella pollutisoli]|uniref:Uncharacterized protein n=1 Tax=Shinella pollutisoli TaxID=2250594 RepID=A0ABV7D9Z4_9HYPH|nr:hypothetical protein [Shinella pollutisoli]
MQDRPPRDYAELPASRGRVRKVRNLLLLLVLINPLLAIAALAIALWRVL